MDARNTQGFTLLELMVALSIFMVISSGAYFLLMGMVSAQHHIEEESRRLGELQHWLMLSDRDMMQLAPVTFPTTPKSETPALVYTADSAQLDFTRRGWSNPLGLPRSELQRIEYHLEDGHIERSAASLPPLTHGIATIKAPALEHVRSLHAQFLDKDQQWQPAWTAASDKPNLLPKAIEFTVDIEGMGTIRQLFPIAGVPDAAQ